MRVQKVTEIIGGYGLIVTSLSYPAEPGPGEMSELAEGARLEIVCTAKSGTEGSNPSLSAKAFNVVTCELRGFTWIARVGCDG